MIFIDLLLIIAIKTITLYGLYLLVIAKVVLIFMQAIQELDERSKDVRPKIHRQRERF